MHSLCAGAVWSSAGEEARWPQHRWASPSSISPVVAAMGERRRVEKYTTPNDSLSVCKWNCLVGSEKWRVWMETDGGGGQRSSNLRWVSVFMRDGPRWRGRGRSRSEWGRKRGLVAPSYLLGSDGSRNLNCTTWHERLQSSTGLVVSARPWGTNSRPLNTNWRRVSVSARPSDGSVRHF